MKIGTGKKVVCAMSGGVDSSAAAALLKEDGYEVVGCFMRLGSEEEPEYDNLRVAECKIDPARPRAHKQGCCSVNDAADARLVAATLGIPFYVLNFRKDFKRIMDYFTDEYNAGRTPNPCVRCNDWLKFGKMHAYAQSIGADFVATGHYARTDLSDPAHPKLLRGADRAKDQSYVLFGAPKAQLAHMLLPVGGMVKPVIRQIAEAHGLPVFNKPDSQEICFVPDNDYARLVEKRTPGGFQSGDIVDADGKKVGTHAGHQHFTLGQRRGLVALGYPIYVVDKNPTTNVVTVGRKEELFSTGCHADQTNWLIEPPLAWRDCRVKIRYNSPPVPAQVRAYLDESGKDALEVRFGAPLEAVTPGQAVVCYGVEGAVDEDVVLGGGWITGVGK